MQIHIYRMKRVNGSENSKEHLKKYLKIQARRLSWPRSIHLCHQKPNPARETVPLRQQKIRNACKKGHEKRGETGLRWDQKEQRLFIIMLHKRPGPPLAVTAITGGNVALQLGEWKGHSQRVVIKTEHKPKDHDFREFMSVVACKLVCCGCPCATLNPFF